MVNCGCLSVASFPLKLLNVHYCSGDSNNLSDHQKVPSVVLQKKLIRISTKKIPIVTFCTKMIQLVTFSDKKSNKSYLFHTKTQQIITFVQEKDTNQLRFCSKKTQIFICFKKIHQLLIFRTIKT